MKKENVSVSHILDYIINLRFISAIIMFVLLVAFKIHGSSIGAWIHLFQKR